MDQEDIMTTSQSSYRQMENSMTPKVTIHSDIRHCSTENPPVKSDCTPECTNKSRKNMIRCMHCMIWFHPKCVQDQNYCCFFRLADISDDELVQWKVKYHLRYVRTDRLTNNLNIDARVRKRTPAFNKPQPPRNWPISKPFRNWSQNNSAVPPLLSFPPPFRHFPWKHQSTCQICFRNYLQYIFLPQDCQYFLFQMWLSWPHSE